MNFEEVKTAEAKAVAEVLRKRECIQPTDKKLATKTDQTDPREKKLPNIDIFVNPKRAEELTAIAKKKRMIAKNYFEKSNMATLFPELFRILWQSTLSCFGGDALRLREIMRINFRKRERHASVLRGCWQQSQLQQLFHKGSHRLWHVLCS